ncbi:hypothetical protein [Loigolactobacillus coryniformis]|uniref:Uncharacterized protein n=1 Tax=Loigolactobacillus coryniformis subsp. torquens DSM 20004 = KCTC 3535 TaxID=1423822 RepID=A0A2D1KML2_9LACO|nr:hypothetical protein [Loigolactobacillus coryniformis]ATO43385.1 hypothetical protein LC20004_05450 [Loigolactobacillus coryniformis subsp. torquens DSM 20004 = KCTC 3535]
MENHDYVYFYLDGSKRRIPVLTGSGRGFEHVFWVDKAASKKLIKEFPCIVPNNFFVLIDKHVFKAHLSEEI